MKQLSFGTIVILLVGLHPGCEEGDLAPFDVAGTPPSVTSVAVGPSAVNIDTLTPNNGVYSVATVVTARASDDGAITVVAEILRPSATSPFQQTSLHDDGIAPDQVARDGIFSASFPFVLTRPQAGRYRIRVYALDDQGLVSNVSELSYLALRNNSAPALANLGVPDTVDLPATGHITVQFSVSASDSDGLADITQVFFRRIAPFDSSATRFFMKDDGSLEPPVSVGGIPVRSGDDVAGDGRFSFLIPLPSTSTRRTNLFGFQAVDTFGDTSVTVQHYFTVR